MTTKIKSLDVSTDRVQALKNQSLLLSGINRILKEALACDTEEELGELCLSVAEEVTGSAFGFIGEVVAESLKVIAIRNAGWDACKIIIPSGHRKHPVNFKMHGLYGHVLKDGQSLFTNDPAGHPDSIGLPTGHPPIKCFLGVPLVYENRLFGIVALGNRPGGFSRIEVQLLESLAPTIVQVLMHKRADKELKRERDLLQSIMNGASNLHLVCLDRDFNFVRVNETYARTCGYKPEGMIGKNHFALYPHQENEAIFKRVRDTGEPFQVNDKPFVFPDQPERGVTYWDWILRPVKDSAGQVVGLIFSLHETTKRKKAEQALRKSEASLARAQSIARLANWEVKVGAGGILGTTDDQVRGSAELYRMFNLEEGQTLKAYVERFHPDDREHVVASIHAAIHEGKPYDIDYRIVPRAGEVRHVHAEGRVIRDEKGLPVRFFGTVQDITERKRAELGLQSLNETLEQQVAERTSELAQTVEVLQEEIEQRVGAEYELKLANERLAQRADQLRRLAGELTAVEQAERKRLSRILHDGLQQHLASAKMQLGGLAEQIENEDLKQAANDIEAIIGESVSMSRSLSAELSPPILHEGGLSEGLKWLIRWMGEKHRFSVDLSLGVVLDLREDVKMLVFESVRELLFNALKHAQASKAQVHLDLVGDGELRVTVSDEGVGFDPCRLLPAGDGGGFGLFSIRERIGLLGGRLEIDSAPGRGSRVVLTVPHGKTAAAPFLVDTVCAPDILPPKDAAEDQETTIRVLLVDDHALFRNGIARLLKNEPGVEIVGEAKDGQEAIGFAQKHKPNVILMDISMPGINGIEATRVIHGQNPEVCIIGLSMYDDPEKERAMRAAGATAYKTKGCAAAELVSAIRAGLQTRKPSPK